MSAGVVGQEKSQAEGRRLPAPNPKSHSKGSRRPRPGRTPATRRIPWHASPSRNRTDDNRGRSASPRRFLPPRDAGGYIDPHRKGRRRRETILLVSTWAHAQFCDYGERAHPYERRSRREDGGICQGAPPYARPMCGSGYGPRQIQCN